jgi:hypothetical protein
MSDRGPRKRLTLNGVNQSQPVLPCHDWSPLSSLAYQTCVARQRLPSGEVILRLQVCRACGTLFCICRSCDRGQHYCSDPCRRRGYAQHRRAANQRHQRSPEGRLDHRDHQRDLRWRLVRARWRTQKSVTDKTPPTPSACPNMPVAIMAIPLSGPRDAQSLPLRFFGSPGWLRCVVCGRRGRFVNPYR